MTKVYRDREAVDYLLGRLRDVGVYSGRLDGALGPLGLSGLNKVLDAYVLSTGGDQIASPSDEPRLAWGARVSKTFRDRVHWIVEDLEMPAASGADDLMSCMAWESNETFSPSVRNMAGSGATGLIQFMPSTALPYFFSAADIAKMTNAQKSANGRVATDRLAAMTAEDQLNYVHRYFRPFKGRVKNLGDLYMAILWPAGVGKPDSFALWDRATRPTTYRQNAGLDTNRDGTITRAEAIGKVLEKKARGFLQGNVYP
jgi:hypothetical protein